MLSVRNRGLWITGGAIYVLAISALATIGFVRSDGFAFYAAAVVLTLPAGAVLPVLTFLVGGTWAIATGHGPLQSAPSALYVAMFGAAALANVFVLRAGTSLFSRTRQRVT
jgi:hypothetical protein